MTSLVCEQAFKQICRVLVTLSLRMRERVGIKPHGLAFQRMIGRKQFGPGTTQTGRRQGGGPRRDAKADQLPHEPLGMLEFLIRLAAKLGR